ncbi:MAG: hypothetical protein Q9227_006260 [Pyrenula ochraceoflavens]
MNRPSVRRSTPSQSNTRIRTSPKSPTKRVFGDVSNRGTPRNQISHAWDGNDSDLTTVSSASEADKENVLSEQQNSTPKLALPRSEKRLSSNFSMRVAASSPLKRSDGLLNLDQASRGSPSAKRRSLHGPSFTQAEYERFFAEMEAQEAKRSSEQSESGHMNGGTASLTHASSIPRRSSSLRKSTLQQRQQDKPANQISKSRQRMSADNFIPPLARESPFNSQGALPCASMHPLNSQQSSQAQHLPHPLSRTMTQSSSNSSITEDPPTPDSFRKPQRPQRPKSMFDFPKSEFSKSLPIGASRPTYDGFSGPDADAPSSQMSFATPGAVPLPKPLPAAFMSTGLISKKNRNVNELHGGLTKAHMPDTPCKRPTINFSYSPNGNCDDPAAFGNNSFGSPATPFYARATLPKVLPLNLGGGNAVFGSTSDRNSLRRKVSFASIDGDEPSRSQSPTMRPNSQSTDSDFPPTPTKIMTDAIEGGAGTPSGYGRNNFSSPSHRRDYTTFHTRPNPTNSKFSPLGQSPGSREEDGDSPMEDSPSTSCRPKPSLPVGTLPCPLTRTRLLNNLRSPTPLSGKDLATSSFSHSPAAIRTKMFSLSPASPLQERQECKSPHTPQENLLPPDPSGLSISGHNEQSVFRQGSSSVSVPPATPTGPKEPFSIMGKRSSLNAAKEFDSCLTKRFGKIELVGTGEFSSVYKVIHLPKDSASPSAFSVPARRSASQASFPDKVSAVKKSKHPFTGLHDRRRKVKEVDVLKALSQSDHVIFFEDSWESYGHLYIQTEFCDEGSLDLFLAQVGVKGRLDDFRIWKILSELALGVKHIHDCGFIHLDLKPANILITFEGTLKIADFGMATKWPVVGEIEGEGDREYIGPEILQGRYDKPADIFALGLIILETAGNIELPENGTSWQKLRNGDMSEVPSLSFSSAESNIVWDASGKPLSVEDETFETQIPQVQVDSFQSSPEVLEIIQPSLKSSYMTRSGELPIPPEFMIDPENEDALDKVVRWMISPNPYDRPVADQVLHTRGVQWVQSRHRAGATIFEGNWGPADEILAEDAEMLDV